MKKGKKPKPERIKKGRGDRPPDSVIDARIDEVVRVLSEKANISKYALRKMLIPKWGCHWITVDRIVIRAREEMIRRLKRDKEGFRCDVLAGLERETECADPRIRLAAWAQIRELLGLDAPRVTQTDITSGGERIVTLTLDPKEITG